MIKTDTPFANIQLFQRVVELGSIRAVARELNLEPSSVSRRIARLESRLGTTLLERVQNKSLVTDAGSDYYERMRVLLPQFEEAERLVAGDAELPKGLLRVNAAIDFGQRYVAQWLLDFRDKYPLVDVDLSLSSRFTDLVAERVDVAIRVGNLPDSALKARKLAEVPRVLVASPGYLAGKGTPVSPEELEAHSHVFYRQQNRQQPITMLGPDGRKHSIKRQGGITINAVYAIVDAVVRGAGLHLGPRWAFQQALDDGLVVEVLPEYQHQSFPMNAVWAPASLLPARTRAFIDFATVAVRSVQGLE
ncbi:MAG: LysR family transcriptional regulator [Pseudomonadota bacterium]